jgi:hypothetical protein
MNLLYCTQRNGKIAINEEFPERNIKALVIDINAK